jgi:hypothetical protein
MDINEMAATGFYFTVPCPFCKMLMGTGSLEITPSSNINARAQIANSLFISRMLLYRRISLGVMVPLSTSFRVNRSYIPFVSLNRFPLNVKTPGSSKSTAELPIISVSPSFEYRTAYQGNVVFCPTLGNR